jgi:hypothetical protein
MRSVEIQLQSWMTNDRLPTMYWSANITNLGCRPPSHPRRPQPAPFFVGNPLTLRLRIWSFASCSRSIRQGLNKDADESTDECGPLPARLVDELARDIACIADTDLNHAPVGEPLSLRNTWLGGGGFVSRTISNAVLIARWRCQYSLCRLHCSIDISRRILSQSFAAPVATYYRQTPQPTVQDAVLQDR